MPDLYDGILGTIGIEIETELSPQGYDIHGWRSTHDASIETPVAYLRGRDYTIARTPENAHIVYLLNRMESRVIGREYTSDVFLEDDRIFNSVRSLYQQLQLTGERTQNQRSGIHIHVGWAYDLAALKRTVRLISWTESLLFHLGGMGYAFRGVSNNSAYCRPLTMYGPPVVQSNLGKVQMTNIESLLSAVNMTSFWNRFGGISILNIPKRYTPQRYMAVNLASIFFHKTLEFRMFNTTMNPEYVIAIAKFCRALTMFTLSGVRFPDEENSVYIVQDRDVNHNILTRLCGLIDIDSNTEGNLRMILDTSPVPTLNHVYVLSHLEDRRVTFNVSELGSSVNLYTQIDNYIKPGIVDVHILENEVQAAIGRFNNDWINPNEEPDEDEPDDEEEFENEPDDEEENFPEPD